MVGWSSCPPWMSGSACCGLRMWPSRHQKARRAIRSLEHKLPTKQLIPLRIGSAAKLSEHLEVRLRVADRNCRFGMILQEKQIT